MSGLKKLDVGMGRPKKQATGMGELKKKVAGTCHEIQVCAGLQARVDLLWCIHTNARAHG